MKIFNISNATIKRKGVKTINEIEMFKGKEIIDIHRWSVKELPAYYLIMWRKLLTTRKTKRKIING